MFPKSHPQRIWKHTLKYIDIHKNSLFVRRAGYVPKIVEIESGGLLNRLV